MFKKLIFLTVVTGSISGSIFVEYVLEKNLFGFVGDVLNKSLLYFAEGISGKSVIYSALVASLLTGFFLFMKWRQRVYIKQLEQQWLEKFDRVKKEQPPQEFIESMESAMEQLCALSAKQAELSRGQTEEAIKNLARRFGKLVNSLNAAVDASKATTGGVDGEDGLDVVAVFGNSRNKLIKVVDRMAQSTQMRDNLKQQVSELVEYTNDLKNMANTVEDIASQTNLLALNAAIEAARAGEMGRGFAVVADEVRGLSTQSGKAGEQIVKMVNRVSESMRLTLASAEQTSIQDQEAETEARESINEVLEELQDVTDGLSNSSNMFKSVSICIVKEINDILVSLQFQDRVSQILGHVIQSMDQFSGVIADKQRQRLEGIYEQYNVTELLNELQQGYTTEEQRRVHKGDVVSGPEDIEIEYF